MVTPVPPESFIDKLFSIRRNDRLHSLTEVGQLHSGPALQLSR